MPDGRTIGIREWTRAAHSEPIVRIGVILDGDAQAVVHLRTPAHPHVLEPGGPIAPETAIEVRRDGGTLVVRCGDGPPVRTPKLCLTCTAAPRLAPGVGVLVRDVVAGRGFHWQKRIDQTLAGALELLPGEHGVIVVNVLGLEDYLAGVITAEMSGACPTDLLKAQCIVARSWLLAMTEPKHETDPFERCNDDCCQRYQGTGDLSPTALAAVRETRGEVLLTRAGNVVDANYAKCCGGVSELPRHVWGLEKPGLASVVDAPAGAAERRFSPVTEANLAAYLTGDWVKTTQVFCSPNVVPPDAIGRYLGRVDESGEYFRWHVTYDLDELEALLREKLPEAADLAELRDLRVLTRGVSGRASRVALDWTSTAGRPVSVTLPSEYRIREVLHRKFLYSSAFAIHVQRTRAGQIERVTLQGAGWGHGVGLCQIGALGMALKGHDYQTICRHYYPEARLEAAYA